MGDILITLGALLVLLVFLLVMISGVMFVGSLFGGAVDLLLESSRRRDEAQQAELAAAQAELDALKHAHLYRNRRARKFR